MELKEKLRNLHKSLMLFEYRNQRNYEEKGIWISSEEKYIYRLLVWDALKKPSIGIERRWTENIKTDLSRAIVIMGNGWSWLRIVFMEGFVISGIEHSGSVTGLK
jgi:hypothetical protein